MKTKYFLLAVVLCLIFSELCFAQWSTDPAENTRVNRWGINPKVTTDGAGGAIIAWEDDYAWGRDIVAQHVDSSGYKRWAEEGVVICNAELDQFMWDGDIVSDGSGGAFIAWRDHRRAVRPETGYQDSADIYLQHIDANGQPLWQENGIRISNGLYYAHHAKMAADDSGGVVIAWINQDTFSYSQFIAVFMQRISSSGEFLWSQDSAKIIAPNYDREPSLAILNDGNKGSIISCSEGIFRFTMQGELSWQVTDIPGRMTDYSIVSDGNGGAIYYYTNRLYPIYYLYLQRVNHHGEILWDDNGIFITTKIPRYWGTSLAPDGEHGAYISWIDSAYTYHYNRINSSGNLLWNDDSISCGIFMGGNNLLSDRNTN
ncbi:MAG: hypothetical protein ONB16_07745, partial [candidate division KSB1 bacterium]|nr:hypothetical protein [candidate division KSB1 bacterium]